MKERRGSINDAPLEKGAPPVAEIDSLTWEEIVARAARGVPGFRTIKKLLGDKRFDR